MPDDKPTPMESVKELFGFQNLVKLGVLGVVVGLLYSAMDRNDSSAKADREQNESAAAADRDIIKDMITDVRNVAKADRDRHDRLTEAAHEKANGRWKLVRDSVQTGEDAKRIALETKQAITDLTTELRVYSRRLPESKLPKSAPKKMND